MRRPIVGSAIGAALVGVVGWRHGLDRADPGTWPPLTHVLGWAALYAAGVGLLTVGWLGAVRWARDRRLVVIVALGVAVHAFALVGRPFLSRDPLAYLAIGRAVARGARSQPLELALPAGDPLVARLQPDVRSRPGVYGIGFDALAGAIARIGGDDLSLSLLLHQLLEGAAIILAGALTGLAAGSSAAALVIFSPLAIIEATQSAHNDALLAVTVALFVWLSSRRAAPTLSLAVGLAVKASAILLLAMHVGRSLARRGARAPVPVLAIGALLVGATVGLAWRLGPPSVRDLTRLIGSPHNPYDYCTRSIECLPRVILRWRLGWPTAAWALGLVFRLAGALWLGAIALASARGGDERRWLATGLFIYYLFLHGWAQSWYFLSLLPLLPWADPRLRPAMLTACVSAVGYYAIAFPFERASSPFGLLLRDLLGGAATIVPPSIMLIRAQAAAPEPAERSTPPSGR